MPAAATSTPADGKKPKFAPLKTLPIYPEIVERLKAGHSLSRIANWIQNSKHECGDVALPTLIGKLLSLRKELSAVALLEIHKPAFIEAAAQQVEKGLDELRELEELYAIQKKRIARMSKNEVATGSTHRNLSADIKATAELLKIRHQIKMDLGFEGGRNLGTLTLQGNQPQKRFMLDINARYGSDIEGVLDDPEKRQRVIDAMTRTLALVKVKQDANVIDIQDKKTP